MLNSVLNAKRCFSFNVLVCISILDFLNFLSSFSCILSSFWCWTSIYVLYFVWILITIIMHLKKRNVKRSLQTEIFNTYFIFQNNKLYLKCIFSHVCILIKCLPYFFIFLFNSFCKFNRFSIKTLKLFILNRKYFLSIFKIQCRIEFVIRNETVMYNFILKFKNIYYVKCRDFF